MCIIRRLGPSGSDSPSVNREIGGLFETHNDLDAAFGNPFAEPLVVLGRKDYPEADRYLDRLFASIRVKPRIAVECDSASSLITEVEAGRGIALANTVFKLVAGKRLLYRPLTGTTEVLSVGIARASKGDVTPAGEKFCEILRKISKGKTGTK